MSYDNIVSLVWIFRLFFTECKTFWTIVVICNVIRLDVNLLMKLFMKLFKLLWRVQPWQNCNYVQSISFSSRTSYNWLNSVHNEFFMSVHSTGIHPTQQTWKPVIEEEKCVSLSKSMKAICCHSYMIAIMMASNRIYRLMSSPCWNIRVTTIF